MKFTWKLNMLLAVFFAIIGVIYGAMSGFTEPVGFAGLLMLAGMAGMVGFYLRLVQKGVGGTRPEDDPEGPVEAEAGEQGTFPAKSWWPLVMAASGAIVILGVALGWWICILGVLFGAVGVVGYAMEFSIGEHAH